jgi:hypothetical protein
MSRPVFLPSRRKFLKDACFAGAALAAAHYCSGLFSLNSPPPPVRTGQRAKLLMGAFATPSVADAGTAQAEDPGDYSTHKKLCSE